jgi:hypothetical protein
MGDIAKNTSEQLLNKATGQATAAVEKITTLRGASARKVAAAVLKAGGDSLRTEYALRLGDPREAIIGASLAVAILACDVVLLGSVAVKGSQRMRALAGVTLAGHVGLVAVAQRRRFLTTAKVNAGLAAAR